MKICTLGYFGTKSSVSKSGQLPNVQSSWLFTAAHKISRLRISHESCALQVQPLLDGCMSSSPAQKESMLSSAKDLAGVSRTGRKNADRKKMSKLRQESMDDEAQRPAPTLTGSSPPQLPAALPSPGTDHLASHSMMQSKWTQIWIQLGRLDLPRLDEVCGSIVRPVERSSVS